LFAPVPPDIIAATMVFNNDLSIYADQHHTPHIATDTNTNTNTNTDADADETATLLGGRGNSTSMSAFGVSRFVIGCVVLSLLAFLFLLNQGTSISTSSSSSVAVINSNNNGADMEDADVTGGTMRDNYIWFIDVHSEILKAKFLYGPSKGKMVSKGQPYGGVFNSSDGKLLVKAGRQLTTAVADAFNKLEGDTLAFDINTFRSIHLKPIKLNFYVTSDIQIDGIGTIKHIALGQGYDNGAGNEWWIKSPNCFWGFVVATAFGDGAFEHLTDGMRSHFHDDNDIRQYICKLTNGNYFVFEDYWLDHARIKIV